MVYESLTILVKLWFLNQKVILKTAPLPYLRSKSELTNFATKGLIFQFFLYDLHKMMSVLKDHGVPIKK